MTLKGRVILNEQEETGNYDFSITECYMTTGFRNTFGTEAVSAAFAAVFLPLKTYPDNADYFQTFRYAHPDGTETALWLIHDRTHYTVLLLEEY